MSSIQLDVSIKIESLENLHDVSTESETIIKPELKEEVSMVGPSQLQLQVKLTRLPTFLLKLFEQSSDEETESPQQIEETDGTEWDKLSDPEHGLKSRFRLAVSRLLASANKSKPFVVANGIGDLHGNLETDLGLHNELDLEFEPKEEWKEEPQDYSGDCDNAGDDNDVYLADEATLKLNGTPETHQIVEQIPADNLPRPFNNADTGAGNNIIRQNIKTTTQYRNEKVNNRNTNVYTKQYDDSIEIAYYKLLGVKSNDNQVIIKQEDDNQIEMYTDKDYACTLCQYTTTTPRSLKFHLKAHYSSARKYICEICSYIACSKRDLTYHIRIHTGEKPLACKTCGKKFARYCTLRRHTSSHLDVKLHACNICNKKFSRKDQLTDHIRRHPGESPYICNICGKQVNSQSKLNHHKKTHTDKAYVCEVCGKKFIHLSYLNSHTIRIHTDEKPHACNKCDKKFSNHGSLMCHIKIHTAEKLFACDTCDKKFMRKADLNSHIRIHTGEKRYACEFCYKKFTVKSVLKNHIRMHTGEKPYTCEVCDKKFAQRSVLICHSRTHTSEKPHVCQVCNKKFAQRNDLTAHTRIHTGEKPYACELCDERFTQRNSLVCHIRKHTGELYYCELCNKKYAQKCNLTEHIRSHTGEKPFACKICDMKFAHGSSLSYHTRKVHS